MDDFIKLIAELDLNWHMRYSIYSSQLSQLFTSRTNTDIGGKYIVNVIIFSVQTVSSTVLPFLIFHYFSE